MPYGHVTEEMVDLLRSLVNGAVVYDLGAGVDISRADELARLGAHRVFAIDKERMRAPRHPRVSRRQGPFSELATSSLCDEVREWRNRGRLTIAFLSYPPNSPTWGLVEILECFDIVVYLGNNFGGTVCGNGPLWDHLVGLKVLDFIENRRNTMIVYGDVNHGYRKGVPEEQAAIHNLLGGGIIRFEDRRDLG